VWIASSPGESLTSAVLHETATSAAYTARVRAIIPVWEKEAAAGHNLGLPGVADRSTAGQLAALADLRASLDRQIPGQVTPAVNVNDPNSFPIRGQRDNSGLFWTATFENDLALCDPDCETTDKYVSKVSINPGSVASSINSSNLYFPNSGNLGNKHFEMWAVCRGIVCGHKNTGDLPNSSRDVLDNYGNRQGDVLTIGITQWVFWNPLGGYYADSGKTHDCDCQPQNLGNSCHYSY
jgi:hypothetical protein